MYPVLTDLSNPNPNNLSRGKLNEMVSCIVHEELNGDYSMTFEYPITGAAYKELVNGGTIRATAPVPHPAGTSDDNVSFDITKQSLPIDGIVTFTAQHVSRRLAGVTNTLLTIDGQDVDQVMRKCYPAVNTGYGYTMPDLNGMTFVSVLGGGVSGIVNLSAPKTCLSTLVGSEDSLVSILGGDFSFKSDGNILYVYYETRRGADNGVSVRYGLNMTDIDMEKETTGTFTAVVPYWDDGNGNITYASGYVVQPNTPVTPVVAVPLDLSSEFSTKPTSAQLVTAARNYLDTNTPWVGTESIKVDLLSGNVQGFSSSDVELGDTVHVYWGDADVAVDLRVVAYDYDVLAERYISIELGTPQTEFVAVTGDASAGASGGGGGSAGNVQYNIYNSVSDLGLTVGSATLAGVWQALPPYSALICSEADFASSAWPATTVEGVYTIIKNTGVWRGSIEFRDYYRGYWRMMISSGLPNGSWEKDTGYTKYITSGSVNLNDYTVPGIYYFASGVTITNVPNSAVNGWLIVLGSGGAVIKQIWTRHGSNPNTFRDTYMRLYASSTWGSWVRFAISTPVTGSVTLSATGFTFSNTTLVVSSGIAFFETTVSVTTAVAGSAVTIGTLPSGYRPSFEVRARFPGQYAQSGSSATNVVFNVGITTAGVISVQRYPASIADGTRIHLSFPVE